MKKEIEKRRKEISELILMKESLRVDELSDYFKVTPETIRSDLRFLEQKGILHRTHGGASLRKKTGFAPMNVRAQELRDVKKDIAVRALDYIQDDSVIFLMSSSTILPLGRMLRLKKNLTIYTNCIELLSYTKDSGHKIFIVGGEYDAIGNRIICGNDAITMLEGIHFDLLITSMCGCKNLDGPALEELDEILLHKLVMKRSEKIMLLSDSGKWDMYAHYQYATFSDFDVIVSDHLDQSICDQLDVKTIDIANV